jgi:hypothetical protein
MAGTYPAIVEGKNTYGYLHGVEIGNGFRIPDYEPMYVVSRWQNASPGELAAGAPKKFWQMQRVNRGTTWETISNTFAAMRVASYKKRQWNTDAKIPI